jgi:hypothetical protein
LYVLVIAVVVRNDLRLGRILLSYHTGGTNVLK